VVARVKKPVRIAMWSGPRNISTALLRAFGNRPDTWVCDEPLYAFYLQQTGLDHPGREEVIAHQETDWRKVVRWLTGPIPHGRAIWYQKHMAHHLLPAIDDRRWLDSLANCFLIREPREMLTSLVKVVAQPRLPDTAFPQQVELLEQIEARTGAAPPVIDARDVLENPRGMLEALCGALGIPFTDAMLSWPPGRRETDGIWAKHWYAEVEKSTGFHPYRPKQAPVPAALAGVLRECERLYAKLHARRLIA
jgi:hypothetical protein